MVWSAGTSRYGSNINARTPCSRSKTDIYSLWAPHLTWTQRKFRMHSRTQRAHGRPPQSTLRQSRIASTPKGGQTSQKHSGWRSSIEWQAVSHSSAHCEVGYPEVHHRAFRFRFLRREYICSLLILPFPSRSRLPAPPAFVLVLFKRTIY